MFRSMVTSKRHVVISAVCILACSATICTATPTTAPGIAMPVPSAPVTTTAPATAPTATTVPIPVAPTPAPSPKIKKKPAAVQKKAQISVTAFVGQVKASHVNVRSGPGLAYYVIGQLARGDLVKVTGERNGWYRFAAPAGARCYIARQFVKLNSNGTTGTVTGSFVNVRAASALSPASSYAVVNLLNTGATVSITGQTPTYYIIRAPKRTGFYILAKFVAPAPAGSTYVTPELKMPPGFKGAGLRTAGSVAAPTSVTPAATATPAVTNNVISSGLSAPVPPVTPAPVINSITVPAPATAAPAPTAAVPAAKVVTMPGSLPPPAVQFSPNSFRAFSRLNRQLQVQFNKPILQRDLPPLLAAFKNLVKRPHLPPSVREGSLARIKLLKKQIAIQEIVTASRRQKPLTAVLAPYQQKWEQSQRELARAQAKAPYIAYGILKTSTVLKDYALMDPETGRVVAYLEPAAPINIAKLLGSYIGVKGEVVSRTGVVVRVIKVTSATMFPEPTAAAVPTKAHP
ncbi:MAG: SH3 domain-containing protein [Phycisphaerae bacterium]